MFDNLQSNKHMRAWWTVLKIVIFDLWMNLLWHCVTQQMTAVPINKTVYGIEGEITDDE